jgi:short chain dehydrogenase
VALIDLYAEPLAEARELIEGAPDKIITIAADTADSGAMGNAVIGIVNRFGRLDGLIANAAVRIKSTLVSELDDEIWDRLLRVNLRGVFRCPTHSTFVPTRDKPVPMNLKGEADRNWSRGVRWERDRPAAAGFSVSLPLRTAPTTCKAGQFLAWPAQNVPRLLFQLRRRS